MSKKTILPILFFMVVVSARAQRFEGGFLAGFNASQVEGASLNGRALNGFHKPGVLAGFYVQTELAPAVFAGMEIKYSQKGARNKINPKNPEPEKYIMRLGYIDIPVYGGFRTGNLGSVIAGVSAGYLIHGKEFNEYGELPEEDRNAFNNLDLQPFIGFKFDFLEQVSADLRFALSVLPIRGQPGEDATAYYWQNNQFNNVISLALYYRIDR